MNRKEASIGVFDSGIGGITILHELVNLLPNENFIYLSDDANCPYGLKNRSEITNLSINNTKWLIDKGVKLIVVACNTATMASIATLRSMFDIKFIGIEPAIKPATHNTKSGVIGVLATKSSVNSQQLRQLCDTHAQDKVVVRQAGVGLVDIVERDLIESEHTEKLLHEYIDPMIEQGVDNLVLGCTHYPFLIKPITRVVGGRGVAIINPARAIAKQTKRVLTEQELLSSSTNSGKIEFYSSSQAEQSTRIANRYEQYREVEKNEYI